MAYDINSKEFAEAWRIVSETLLSTLQNGSSVIDIVDSADKFEKTVKEPSNPNVVEPLMNHGSEETLFAVSPVNSGDGYYLFKNLKYEKQDNSIFEIKRFEDGYCEFTLCDLNPEARQILFDQKNSLLPSAVGECDGEIKLDNGFQTIRKGIGERSGRSVRILEPMKIKFN